MMVSEHISPWARHNNPHYNIHKVTYKRYANLFLPDRLKYQ